MSPVASSTEVVLGREAREDAGLEDTAPHLRWVDQRWMDAAACHGHTSLFFPTYAERPQARQRREARARALCDSCVVQETCRSFARENHEYGIWGNENEEERVLAGYSLIAPIGTRNIRRARLAAMAPIPMPLAEIEDPTPEELEATERWAAEDLAKSA
jgi:WhiB family transcriptional regulator, redox-sensing transcriptional regulator